MEEISIETLRKIKKEFEKSDKELAKVLGIKQSLNEKIEQSKKVQKIWEKTDKWKK